MKHLSLHSSVGTLVFRNQKCLLIEKSLYYSPFIVLVLAEEILWSISDMNGHVTVHSL